MNKQEDSPRLDLLMEYENELIAITNKDIIEIKKRRHEQMLRDA